MDEITDAELLQQYATHQSDDAFAVIVRRYLGLVRGTALRQLGNQHQADDVCHAVFLALARKAASMPAGIILAGWLFKATRFAAAKLARDEERRVRREREAAMSHVDIISEQNEERVWENIAPHLNEALECLTAKERDAVLVRYFQQQSFAQAGRILGASEDAAKMRVSRAMEKLRRYFWKRGFISGTAALTCLLDSKAFAEIPPSLVKEIATTGASGGGAVAVVSTLAESILRYGRWLRVKLWLIIAGVALLVISILWITGDRLGWFRPKPTEPVWVTPGQQWPTR